MVSPGKAGGFPAQWLLHQAEGSEQLRLFILTFLVPFVRLSTNELMRAAIVHGVDVWINTPRRPRSACGTSGMKVLVDGGINISELNGTKLIANP